ncbi:MAG: 50S ribosomal protein L4 [Alphaproteobacteria bacterium CG11_big_fil_rev_8_21_14_0_20_44_7]|nr:MAG: 50S ribosomal protein L4 [Alphaproteobacteria bacterium CG11_big_fil_rev_8_21_14_0_20_44_7]
MKAKLYTIDFKESGEVELNKEIFGIDPRQDILYRVVHWQLAKRRAGTQSTLTRSEVRGTTKKPFAQKGTGNARQGSLKGPHQYGGGVAHAPKPRDYSYALPKKVRVLGLKMALSAKAKENKIMILKDAKLKTPKTKDFSKSLDKQSLKSVLFIDGDAVDENFRKAIGNLVKIDVLPSAGANVYDILQHENLILTESAVKKLEERLA